MRRPPYGMSGPRSTAAAMCTRPSSTSTASSNRCRSWRCRRCCACTGTRSPGSGGAGPDPRHGGQLRRKHLPAGYLRRGRQPDRRAVCGGTMALRQGQEALASAPGGALSRSDPSGTGIQRRRCGRGFSYLGPDTAVITDPRTLARIKALVIPPAWEDVWICVDPQGHIQAIGTDAAGRRQYRYHDLWREQRDQDKHDRVREFGAALPRIREVVGRHLEGRGLTRDQGPRGGDPPDRPRFLPAGRGGVRRGERHLRAGDHPEGACDAQPGPAGVRIPGQGRQAS